MDPCHDKLAQLKARLGCVKSEVPPLEDDDDETDSGAATEDETLPLAAVVKERPTRSQGQRVRRL